MKIRKRSHGRPRKPGPRTASGKRTPSTIEREVKAVAIEGRMNQYGLSEKDAGSDLAGHVLGRIFIDGKIDRQQLEAGLAYGDDMRRYYSAYMGVAPTVSAQNLMKVRGFDGDVSEAASERGRKALNRCMELEALLLQCGVGVKPTVYNVCVDDLAGMREMPPQQMALLKKGLTALVKCYGIPWRI